MVKKLAATLLTAGAILTASQLGSSGLGRDYLENDLKTLNEWSIHEANRRERKLEDFMRQNPSISKNEAKDALQYSFPIPVDHFELTTAGNYTGSTVEPALSYLTDESIWKKFYWKSFDQLPGPIHEHTLNRMFGKYGYASGISVHIDHALRDDVPEPVIVANLLKKIQYWTIRWNPDLSDEGLEKLTDRTIAILLQESFATSQAKGKDLGPFQISPETVTMIKKHPDFKKYAAKDFLNWDVSAKAGTYWLSQCLIDAGGDLNLATGAYNAGIVDAKNKTLRARNYTESVKNRQMRYVNISVSPTWRYILDKSGIKTKLDREIERTQAIHDDLS